MPADMFLEIVTKKGGKIKGESIDVACSGQIDVDKFEMGISSPEKYDKGSIGRITLEQAKFDFSTSIATLPIFQTLCTNDQIKSATLTVRKGGGTGKEAIYLQVRFNDARLLEYKMTGSDEYTDDSITISYTGVELSYRQQKADGTLAAAQSASYDSNSNTMVKPTLNS